MTAQRVDDPMTRAIFDGVTLAESDDVTVVDGMTYFPADTVNRDNLSPSQTTTRCPWKGEATYFNVHSPSGSSEDAAFTYLDPSQQAKDAGVEHRIAFWKGVRIER